MPRVIGKVEGRGNGIKTVIFNVMDLSLALKRDPGEVCKFFGTELGAQASATVQGGRVKITLMLRARFSETVFLSPF